MFANIGNSLPINNLMHTGLLNKLTEVIDSLQIESLKRELSIINRFFSENGSVKKFIDVAVLGQFKAGKSSLINDLINEDVLPTGVIPVTSIITRLQYAKEKSARVNFLDGHCKDIGISEIDNFITESKNPKNFKKVELVDLFLPQLSHIPNVRIIDTPGIGSFFKHNTDTAMQWLPEIGLALITISAERPLAEDDVLLLKTVKTYAANTHIILTKSDLISVHQIQEVVDFIRIALANEDMFRVSGFKNLIIPYSIYKDSDKNRMQLVEEIILPLNENHIQYYEKIINHKIDALLKNCLSYLEIGLDASFKTETEKENLKDLIIGEQLKFQTIKNELDIISQSLINKNRDVVASVVMSFLKETNEILINKFRKEFDNWNGNLYKLSRKFESWVEDELKELLIECSDKSILRLNEYVLGIQNHFSLFVSSFTERLNHNIEKVLGIRLNNVALQPEVEKIKQPDILVSTSFDINIDLLWFLFPMFMFRKIFKKIFLKRIPREAENNLNRLTSDIAENIRKEIERNKKVVSQYIYSELSGVETVLKNRKNESDYFKKSIDEIKSLMKKLE